MTSLDTIGAPFGFEAIYLRPKHRRLKEGDRFSIEMEIDKDAWEAFLAADPANSYAVLVSKLDPATMQEGEAKTQPAPPGRKERGEFGYISQRIYKAGIPDVLPVRSALAIAHDATTEQAFAAIREAMASYWDVPSSTYCSPQQWREWAEVHHIGQFIVPLLMEAGSAAR